MSGPWLPVGPDAIGHFMKACREQKTFRKALKEPETILLTGDKAAGVLAACH